MRTTKQTVPVRARAGSFKGFSFPVIKQMGRGLGTQGEQEINFSLDHVNFEAVFGRCFEHTIEQL